MSEYERKRGDIETFIRARHGGIDFWVGDEEITFTQRLTVEEAWELLDGLRACIYEVQEE